MINTRCKVGFIPMGESRFSGVLLDTIQVVQGVRVLVVHINKYK